MISQTKARRGRQFLAVAAGAALVLAVASCGDDDDGDAGSEGVTVSDAWARTSPAMTSNGAIYLELRSGDGDVLVGASVPETVAATTEIHETVAATDGMSDSTAMGDTTAAMSDTTAAMTGTTAAGMGEMTMRPIESLEIPAGSTINLEPGGYHIMLLDLVKPLEVGSEIELTLTFEKAGELTITVPVRESAP